MTRTVRLRLAALVVVAAAVLALVALGPLRRASADTLPGVGQAGSDRLVVTLSGISDGGIQAVSYEASLTKPVSAGQATGKTVLSPVVFRHAFDESTPLIARAASQNQLVARVVFTAYQPTGEPKLRITLRNVTVQGVRQYLPDTNANDNLVARVPLLEEVTLAYRSIEWCAYSNRGTPVCTVADNTAR